MRSTAPTDVHEYCKLLAKSRLIPAEETSILLMKWQSLSSRNLDDVDGFRKFLVQARQLTDYQSHLVMRGHSEGFFLDQYRILDLTGRGRMAGVYKSVHESSGQIVAIKVLPGSKAKDPKTLGRFIREGKLLSQLDHPHIVRAFHVGETGNRHFLVMEYLEGETLDEVLIRRVRLPIPETIRLINQILLGLEEIHRQGMVHRDLKPANLMLVDATNRGDGTTTLHQSVKILDIGLGRTIFDENEVDPDAEEQLTATNSMLGTPDYMAPEQAKSARDVDIRADLYSVGCILFRCLVGEPVFPDTNIIQQAMRHATEAPRSVQKLVPGVSESLQKVMNKLLAKKPEERFSTPTEVIRALQQAMKAFVDPNPGKKVSVQQSYQEWLESTGSVVVQQPATKVAPALVEEVVAPSKKVTAVPPPPPLPKVSSSSTKMPALPKAKSEYDVEVVPIEPIPAYPVIPTENRSLWDIDKRDIIMLSIGAFGVLFAILSGYGLSQVLRPKEEPKSLQVSPVSTEPQTTTNDPTSEKQRPAE